MFCYDKVHNYTLTLLFKHLILNFNFETKFNFLINNLKFVTNFQFKYEFESSLRKLHFCNCIRKSHKKGEMQNNKFSTLLYYRSTKTHTIWSFFDSSPKKCNYNFYCRTKRNNKNHSQTLEICCMWIILPGNHFSNELLMNANEKTSTRIVLRE